MSSEARYTRWGLFFFFCAIGGAAIGSCGGEPARSLPPPKYERPELPSWKPPSSSADPFDAGSMEGEWVDEDSTQDRSGNGGAGGAPAAVERAGPA